MNNNAFGKNTPNNFTQYNTDADYYKQYKSTDIVTQSKHDYNFDGNNCLKKQNRAILMIDSKKRRNNEEPNSYTVVLPKEYMSVISIELVRADIPNSNYIINEYNNCFYFQDSLEQTESTCGMPYHKIILPIGDYLIDSDDASINTIRSMLEIALNSVNLSNVYTVVVDDNQNKFTISQTSGSGFFNILFQEPQCSGNVITYNYDARPLKNNIGSILGFKTATNKIGQTTYTGEYKYNLYPNRYIVLKLNDYDKQFNRLDSNNDVAQNSFICLGLNLKGNDFSIKDDCNYIDNEEYRIAFNPPLNKLTKFNIQFFDCNGNPYNFRGIDHFLVFEIHSLTRFNEF